MQTVFIALILLLLFILYLGFRRKFETTDDPKNYFALQLSLDRVISRYKLAISEIGFFKNAIIGLDSGNNKLVSILQKRNVISERCFPLSELGSCRVIRDTDQLTGYVKRIELELILRCGEIIGFIFFDEQRDNIHELPSRIRKAKYWKSKIQLRLNSLKQGHKFEYVL